MKKGQYKGSEFSVRIQDPPVKHGQLKIQVWAFLHFNLSGIGFGESKIIG
jgi:hypothetical protein